MSKIRLEVIRAVRKIYCVDENLDIDSALKLVELNKIRAEANSTEIYLTHYDFLEPIKKN